MKSPLRLTSAFLAAWLGLALGGAVLAHAQSTPAPVSATPPADTPAVATPAPAPAAPGASAAPRATAPAGTARRGGRGGFRGPMPANPALPTIWLIGDSTVRNGAGNGGGGQWGWGEPFADLIDPAKANLVNRAVGGLSSRTFLTGGNWERVLPQLKAGDIVIMQFGHNDGGAVNDATRARASIRGVGEDTQEIDNQLTGQKEVVHSFGWYLRKFIADTKAKGATPVVCSLVPRKIWADGKINRDKASYAGWAAEVAVAEKVGFIDLNELIAAEYDKLGTEKVEPLFADAHTHTSRAGAELNAAIVVVGLKALKDDPVAKYFSAKGQAVTPANLGVTIPAATPAAAPAAAAARGSVPPPPAAP